MVAEANLNDLGETLGYRMMDAILRDGLALAMPNPSLLETRTGLTDSRTSHANEIIGVNRFNPLPEDEDDKQLCDFWQHWCTPSSHRYPLLLWLQRSYVAGMDGDPVAGRDEDTPYDYDHIVPHLHWGDWTGYAKGTRILEFMKKPYVIGNCIGNIRAWGSSDNRSDGALAPAKKLQKESLTLKVPLFHRLSKKDEEIVSVCSETENIKAVVEAAIADVHIKYHRVTAPTLAARHVRGRKELIELADLVADISIDYIGGTRAYPANSIALIKTRFKYGENIVTGEKHTRDKKPLA